MSEKTLASGKQMLTLGGRLLTGLAPVKMKPEIAKFWIDLPDATNYRIARFAKLPTIVQIAGYRLGETRGLATLIQSV